MRLRYRLASGSSGYVDMAEGCDGYYSASVPGGASGSVKLVAELGAGSGKWDSKGRSGWGVSGSAVTPAYGNVYKAAHSTTCTTTADASRRLVAS